MQLSLIKFGKPVDNQYVGLVERFAKRIKGFKRFNTAVYAVKSPRDKAYQTFLQRERLPHATIIGLDENGEPWTSPQLAKVIEDYQLRGTTKHLVFVIGGPYGLPSEVKQACDRLWSLAPGVYPSDLAWVMTSEQIYRALTISSNLPYHHA